MMGRIALESKIENEILNIGSDEAITLNELSEIILEEFSGTKAPKKLMPRHMPDRPREVKFAFCSHKKIEKISKYKAEIELRDGLRKTIEWAKLIGSQKFVYLDKLELQHKDTPKTWVKKLY